MDRRPYPAFRGPHPGGGPPIDGPPRRCRAFVPGGRPVFRAPLRGYFRGPGPNWNDGKSLNKLGIVLLVSETCRRDHFPPILTFTRRWEHGSTPVKDFIVVRPAAEGYADFSPFEIKRDSR